MSVLDEQFTNLLGLLFCLLLRGYLYYRTFGKLLLDQAILFVPKIPCKHNNSYLLMLFSSIAFPFFFFKLFFHCRVKTGFREDIVFFLFFFLNIPGHRKQCLTVLLKLTISRVFLVNLNIFLVLVVIQLLSPLVTPVQLTFSPSQKAPSTLSSVPPMKIG